jgi:hypothetical protein
MSRPQFPVNAPASQAPGPVVNGGLIDFQDNFHRGMAEYAQQFAAQQSLATLAAAYPGLASQFPSALQASGQFSAGFPVPVTQAVPGLPTALPPSTTLGHPSFINVAGKMYKPVEEPAQLAEAKKVAHEPETRVMTEDDIDRRVEEQVERWASAQRRPQSRSIVKSRHNDEERAAARVKSVNAGMYRSTYYSPM